MLSLLGACSGVMNPPTDILTTQGYDLQIGTNVIGTQPSLS